MADTSYCEVPPDAAGERADRYLAELLGESRNQVQHWIRSGLVSIGGEAIKASHSLVAGDRLEWSIPETRNADLLSPEPGPLRVLYEDRHLAAIDKPAGIAVHPGAGRATGTLAHRVVARWPEASDVGSPARPGIVHRLDLDTTGVLLIALTKQAYQGLTRCFAERRVDKRYQAICWGVPEPATGLIDRPIGRHPKERKKMTVRPDGRPAITTYEVSAAAGQLSFLDVSIHTGRTHQIRVHLKALGHPLVGDPLYGEARWRSAAPSLRRPLREFPRPALHALRLELDHPVGGQPLTISSPLPEDLASLWELIARESAPAP